MREQGAKGSSGALSQRRPERCAGSLEWNRRSGWWRYPDAIIGERRHLDARGVVGVRTAGITLVQKPMCATHVVLIKLMFGTFQPASPRLMTVGPEQMPERVNFTKWRQHRLDHHAHHQECQHADAQEGGK